VLLDHDACYRALQTRDARFDGRIFVGVRTTGIYCRPICPARCARRENVDFYPSAAAAQEAGFRPCLRCRPECSPDLAAWKGTSSTVSRALALIADGALDGDDGDLEGLAARLGIGDRQLRRLFRRHLGASPIAVAQTRRVLLAKQLLHETRMNMTDVASAAGFGSLRRFNDTFRRLYSKPPSELRRQAAETPGGDAAHASLTLTLSYAPPYDWAAMMEFFAARAIDGVEIVEPHRYRRTISLDGVDGTIDIRPLEDRPALATTIRFPSVRALPTILARIRRMFDLGADISAISRQLGEDPHLAPLVAARPGLRVPGAWDGFEMAVRAILGQQITVSGARTLATRLVENHGRRFTSADGGGDTPSSAASASASRDAADAGAVPRLTHVFPEPERLVNADLAALGLPRSRAASLSGLADCVIGDPRIFRTDRSSEEAVSRLREIPGVGEWTAEYIAMRVLREPDAFPAADLGLLRAMAGADGVRPSPQALLEHAEAWRPWRAYAAQHLWSAPRLERNSANASSKRRRSTSDERRPSQPRENVA
jgi:AraC family transcriptional regulator of adaptative response / DNA-3-methyladenine glycosylase II